jgi:hypothetical protein
VQGKRREHLQIKKKKRKTHGYFLHVYHLGHIKVEGKKKKYPISTIIILLFSCFGFFLRCTPLFTSSRVST